MTEFETLEAEITCGGCHASDDNLTVKTTDEGQYKWSRCGVCGAKNLSNGLVEYDGGHA